MKICSKCGAKNDDNSKFCESCGNTFIDNSNYQSGNNTSINSMGNQVPNYDTVRPDGQPIVLNGKIKSEKPQKPKLDGSQVLISVVVVIFVAVVSIVGGKLIGSFMNKHKYSDIDKYIERVKDYKPGTVEGDVYTSEHFGLVVELDDGWTFDSEEEQAALKKEFEESILYELEATGRSENISAEELKKVKESFDVDLEFSASYTGKSGVSQYIAVACRMYGVDDYAEENSAGETELIAGKRFDKETGTEYANGISVNTTIYTTEKDGVMLMITCYSFGDADEAAEDFIRECIKAK